MIIPLTDLVGEVGETKVRRSTGTKIKIWYWTHVNKEVFDQVKHTLAENVILAYPTYRELFEVYTNASTSQLGKTKLIIELELRSIVECL